MPSVFTLSGSWYDTPSQVKKNLHTLEKRKRRPKAKRGLSGVDQVDNTTEGLRLLIDNEGSIYPQMQAARRMLVKKACSVSALDVELGSRLFLPIVQAAAKQAKKDYGGYFSLGVRKAVAKEYAAEVKRQINACQRSEKWGCNDLPDGKLPAGCKLPPGGLTGARKR